MLDTLASWLALETATPPASARSGRGPLSARWQFPDAARPARCGLGAPGARSPPGPSVRLGPSPLPGAQRRSPLEAPEGLLPLLTLASLGKARRGRRNKGESRPGRRTKVPGEESGGAGSIGPTSPFCSWELGGRAVPGWAPPGPPEVLAKCHPPCSFRGTRGGPRGAARVGAGSGRAGTCAGSGGLAESSGRVQQRGGNLRAQGPRVGRSGERWVARGGVDLLQEACSDTELARLHCQHLPIAWKREGDREPEPRSFLVQKSPASRHALGSHQVLADWFCLWGTIEKN